MIPEKLKTVQGSSPATTNGGITCDYISMKNVQRAWIIVSLTQAAGHATGIDPVQASAVDGTGAKALTDSVPIWANEDTAAADTMVRQTDAVTYNVSADVKNKVVVFQVDPAYFDHANGFDVLGVTVDDSSQATNFASVTYVCQMRYAGDNAPAVITD